MRVPGRAWLRFQLMVLALRRSGARAILALASVGAGIAALMIVLALATGAERELEAIAGKVGRNLFTVTAGRVLSTPGRGQGWYTSTRLDRNDLVALRQRVPALAAVAPVLERSLRVELGRESLATSVRGVTSEFVGLRRFALGSGRLLDARDDLERSRVAVVGSFTAQRLADGAGLVGRTLVIAGVPFLVVGELAEKGASADGQNEDDQVLVPLETARRRLYNVDWLTRLILQVEDATRMDAAQAATRAVLRERHRLAASDADDFEVLSLLRTSEIRRRSLAFLQGLAQIFAAVTLAVGGGGVLAVTYLNVRERTAEIGLRMAVGARRRDIAGLFVAEASLLSLAGGLFGLLVGSVAVAVLRFAVGWQMVVDLRGIALPFVVAVALGLVFGVAPALRAARVMPVEALRGS